MLITRCNSPVFFQSENSFQLIGRHNWGFELMLLLDLLPRNLWKIQNLLLNLSISSLYFRQYNNTLYVITEFAVVWFYSMFAAASTTTASQLDKLDKSTSWLSAHSGDRNITMNLQKIFLRFLKWLNWSLPVLMLELDPQYMWKINEGANIVSSERRPAQQIISMRCINIR